VCKKGTSSNIELGLKKTAASKERAFRGTSGPSFHAIKYAGKEGGQDVDDLDVKPRDFALRDLN